MLVNSILVLCVSICPQVCIRDRTTMKKHKISRQGKIEFGHLKICSCHTFKQPDLNVKLRVTTLQENRKKNDCFSVDGYCNHCKTLFEAMGCYFYFCPCEEARPSLTDDDMKRGTQKREMDELRKNYIREKDTLKKKCGSVAGGISLKTM